MRRYDSLVVAGGMARADAPYSDFGRATHAHPALAEGVDAAGGGVHRSSRD